MRIPALSLILLALSVQGSFAETTPIRFRLPNGLRVILRPVQGARKAAVVVHFDIGGNHDPAGKSGMAHLLEHVYCTAAASSVSARTAEQWMADGGNAQTGEDYTFFAEQFDGGRLDAVLTDAAARMRDLRPDQALLERERVRLVNEVSNMYGGMPALAVTNIARERVRPTPLRGRRGGIPVHVEKITLADLRSRLKLYYAPANATLVVAGGFEAKKARETIGQLFKGIPAGQTAPAAAPLGAPELGQVKTIQLKTLQPGTGAEACVTFGAPSAASPHYVPFLVFAMRMMVAAEELGAKMGQRFPPCVQYAVMEDPAVIALGAPVRKGQTPDEAVARIRKFISKHTSKALTEADREMTRMALGTYLGLYDPPDWQWAQNPYGLALSLARRQHLRVDTARLKKALSDLTDTDLRRTAKALFSPHRSAAVVATPP